MRVEQEERSDYCREHNICASCGRDLPKPAPTVGEIEMMIEEAAGYSVGDTTRSADGMLRTYYAGFNLSAVAAHIARELAQK